MTQKQSMVILVNYKDNYDTTTTTTAKKTWFFSDRLGLGYFKV